MGTTEYLTALYDEPRLIHDINRFSLELAMNCWGLVLQDLEIDCAFIFEDMSYKSGSLVSPAMFDEFMAPYYRPLIGFLSEHGVRHVLVDSDGLVDQLIPGFLDVGLTGLFPMEAVNDTVRIRRDYPRLQMLGGIDKRIRIDKVMNLVAYVTGKLANLSHDEAFIEASYLSWHGLADTRNRCWSDELASTFDLPLEKVPRIVDACEVVGGLSKEAANFCGIPSGVPLVAGTGDQVATHIGAGVVEAGYLMDGAGTFSVLGTCVDSFFADTRHGIWSVLAAPESLGLWYPIMYIGGGGLVHRWSAGLFFEHLFSESSTHATTSMGIHYSVLDHLAGEVHAGSDGLIFVPHLYGRSCPEEPETRGARLGMTTSHTPAHLFRSVLESIAYDYALSLEALRDYRPDVDFKGVRVTGGGAASHLWTQIKASVLGIPYGGLQRSSVAAAGSAMFGGHAVGLFSDIASVAKGWAVLTDTTLPRPRLTSLYRHYVQAYRQALKELKGVNQTLETLRNQPENHS
jgi:xylulokinase